jgi:hypothetical protein
MNFNYTYTHSLIFVAAKGPQSPVMTLIQTLQVPNAIALLIMMKMMTELVCPGY